MLFRVEETSLIGPTDDADCAFTMLYNQYFPRIYNYVTYRVTDFHTAEDLTSQIFEKMFKKLECYRPDRAAFSAWLFSIARNTVIDYYRSRERICCSSLEILPEIIDYVPGPDDIAAFNEVQHHMLRALTVLSQRERDIIALKFWGGLSNIDIARLIDISESNAGVVLFRALKKLRTILEGQGMNILG